MQTRTVIETGLRPLVVLALIAVTLFIFILQQLSAKPNWVTGPACGWQLVCPRSNRVELLHRAAYSCQDLPACWGKKISPLISAGQVWRLLTPVFLHADWAHLSANLLALFVWARRVEPILGRRDFLFLYLLAGFAGFATSYAFEPASALGASGAVFGVLAAWVVIVYRNHWVFGYDQALLIAGYVLSTLYFGLQDPLIDNWGHLGGFVGGLLFAWQAAPAYQVQRWSPRAGYQLGAAIDSRRSLRAAAAVFVLFGGLAACAWWLQR